MRNALPMQINRRQLLLLLGGASSIGALSACASIPTAGPVTESDPGVSTSGQLVQTASGPVEDATPKEIVSGFLRACVAGFSDDFLTARSFLAGTAADTWNPEARVRIYPNAASTTVAEAEDGGIVVTAPAHAVLDDAGIYTASGDEQTHTVQYALATNADGQWRIVELADGIFLSASAFASSFTGQQLYFLTHDRTRFLPDLRWYPQHNLANRLMNGLLDGPSQWLLESVSTASPSGLRLNSSGVSIDSGIATVGLSEEMVNASEEDYALFYSQVERTLTQLTTVQSVTLEAAGRTVSSTTANIEDQIDPGGLVGISDEGVVRSENAGLTVLADAELFGDAQIQAPALGADGELYALKGDALISVNKSGYYTLLNKENLLAPRVDRFGWVWTSNGEELYAVNASGASVTVSCDWLSGEKVLAFDLSAESGRIAVLYSSGDTSAYAAAVIVRDESGKPQSIGSALSLGELSAVALVWANSTAVAVLSETPEGNAPEVQITSVSGPSESFTAVEDVTGIASNRTDGNVLLNTSDLRVWLHSGAAWRVVNSELEQISYPLV